jgi:3-methyl-2-oxobutanoate hydroxymethyltransferase
LADAPWLRPRSLLDEALELERAGCFAVVLEAVPSRVAARITAALEVPTIGIGAGPDCDGQVLVYHDLLGLYEGRAPRFVKRYADVATEIGRALEEFAAEVRSGAFPEEQHTYSMPDEELRLFERSLAEDGEQGGNGDQRESGERTRRDRPSPAPAVHDTHAQR